MNHGHGAEPARVRLYLSPGLVNFPDALLASRLGPPVYLGTAAPAPQQIAAWAQALRRAGVTEPVWVGCWPPRSDPHSPQRCYTLQVDGEAHIVAVADPDERYRYLSMHTDAP